METIPHRFFERLSRDDVVGEDFISYKTARLAGRALGAMTDAEVADLFLRAAKAIGATIKHTGHGLTMLVPAGRLHFEKPDALIMCPVPTHWEASIA